MPTGYTCGVSDGKVRTLTDFAKVCARGMGALIAMRDDPWDAPIPGHLEPSTEYHNKHIAEAEAALADVPKLSAARCEERAQAAFDDAMKAHLSYAANKAESKANYEAMIAKVEAWSVPDDLATFKSFMLSQLQDSLKFDCGGSYRPEPPVRLTGERWREQKLEKASRDLAYHKEERAKELQRTADRNRWLKAFHEALPTP